jgi:hypothetical protein
MKRFTFVLFLLLICFSVVADPVDLKRAKNVAMNYYKFYAPSEISDYSITDWFENQSNGSTTLYTFVFKSGGFVIVAADDASIPVVGYSFSSPAPRNTTNVAASQWLGNVSTEVDRLRKLKASNIETKKQWDNILAGKFKKGTNDIDPLIQTKWNQDEWTNLYCPAFAKGPGGRVYAGCVAITMGQIMYYYKFPVQGIGSKSYTPAKHPEYGTLTANFGTTTYNYANMPIESAAATTEQTTAVSTLIYQAGVAVSMNYNSDDKGSSGASSYNVPNALTTYFNYDQSSISLKIKSNYTDQAWIDMLRAELDARRPFYYSGDDGTSGHAWVCDGYKSADNTFHFNWGWGGSNDGFFVIGSLNPDQNNFNLNNNVVIGIKPGNANLVCRFDVSNTNYATGFGKGEAVPITVNMIKGTATKIDLYIDDAKVSEAAANTLTYSWNTAGSKPGIHAFKAVAAGEQGTAYAQSAIALSAWNKQATTFASPNRLVDQIHIVNDNVAWAKAVDATNADNHVREFTKTSNGGTTWTTGQVSFAGSNSYDIANIVAVSDQTAWACMYPYSATGYGYIVKTTDGGSTWTKQTTADFTNSFANWVYFWNENDGVCMGDSYNNEFFLFTTSDGGTTWNKVAKANYPTILADEAGTVNLFDVVGNTIWFGTSKGRVFKSTNKGHNWTASNVGLGGVQTHVSFKDDKIGFAWGSSESIEYSIKKSTNGGTSWTAFSPGENFNSLNLEFVPGTASTWVSGGGNGSSISYDDGITWTEIDNTVDYGYVKFLNPKTAWAGGYNSSATNGGIFKWEPLKYNVKFIAKNSAGAVMPNVKFDFNGESKNTDANGEVSFANVIMGSNLVAQYAKEGTVSYSHTFDVVKADVTVDITIWMTGVDEKTADASILLYPNPASSQIRLYNATGSKCQLYSINGQLLTSFTANSDDYLIDISKLAKGNYLLRFEKENKTYTRRFEVVR